MSILDELKGTGTKDYNTLLESEKKAGKKIIGYFCSYFPEEIVHAAGFIPYRMTAAGSTGTTKGDIYFSSLNCTFVKHCFDKALQGGFDFLDGIVFLNGCDHTRRMYDNWIHADMKPDFRYMFVVPHKTGELAERRFTEEIEGFKTALEKEFHITISEDAIRESIGLYNRKRSLLSELYQRRYEPKVPINGSEVLRIMLAITVLPVEKAIDVLEKILVEIADRDIGAENKTRIFLASGCIEEVEHLELIESCGAVIVADNICLGARHFDTLVDETNPVYEALSMRYLNHLSCSRMVNDFANRSLFVQLKMKEANAVALIGEKLKFCDIWGGDLYLLRQEAKKYNFPMLSLERELYGGGEGQIRTRVQAFLEQVKNREVINTELLTAAGNDYQAKP